MNQIVTRFFCFPDMETSFQLAAQMGMVTVDDMQNTGFLAYTDKYAIDVVGTIYRPSGKLVLDDKNNPVLDEDGNQIHESVAIPGWHVNSRILTNETLPEAFAQYEVFPITPERDFF